MELNTDDSSARRRNIDPVILAKLAHFEDKIDMVAEEFFQATAEIAADFRETAKGAVHTSVQLDEVIEKLRKP